MVGGRGGVLVQDALLMPSAVPPLRLSTSPFNSHEWTPTLQIYDHMCGGGASIKLRIGFFCLFVFFVEFVEVWQLWQNILF